MDWKKIPKTDLLRSVSHLATGVGAVAVAGRRLELLLLLAGQSSLLLVLVLVLVLLAGSGAARVVVDVVVAHRRSCCPTETALARRGRAAALLLLLLAERGAERRARRSELAGFSPASLASCGCCLRWLVPAKNNIVKGRDVGEKEEKGGRLAGIRFSPEKMREGRRRGEAELLREERKG
ncbi:hypothetical protein KY290_012925 [Solanum tuberosum]|uniref:Uncharacterized protein n=1 Tax=Solanum tuberosum TaxID=4113 RepID=A0ABQ7VMH2_SOLTU|nr:hypothetical protein KY285_012695 [Solanum tuberosum]KAH0768944.1 hypothetical protein KY290_012925 [Solanum tuberosum]